MKIANECSRKAVATVAFLTVLIFAGVAVAGPPAARPRVETPVWPKEPPASWLTFHLAHPGPGKGVPADPNCAFDYKGRYHLHYIYRNRTGFVFAHVSSDDMVYWKWQPTVLGPQTVGHGMFSGTGFYTIDGRPAIIYHGQGSGRNWIQYPLDDQLNSWSKPVPVLPKDADGKVPGIRHFDPDCWVIGKTYYALSGGKNPKLMKSTDLKNWTYLGDLLHDDYPAKKLGVPRGEDISCANIFKIGDKWMLLCISHPMGCRYYLGDFKGEKYLPEFHAKMNWKKVGPRHGFFAPESMLTRDGRRVMWTWLRNMPTAPTGVQSLPRELELPKDGVLRIRPIRELAKLRYQPQAWSDITIKAGREHALGGIKGDALEIEITFAAPLPAGCGLHMLGDAGGKGGMSIIAGANRKTLQVGDIKPPFELKDKEDLTLRVFIDKNLIEVFANDRQGAVYVHKDIRRNPNIRVFARGGDATVKSVRAWRMKTIYKKLPRAAKPPGE